MATHDPTPTVPPPSPQHPKRRRYVFFAVSGIGLLLVLILFREILLPFLLAAIIAYVFAPIVTALQRAKIAGRPTPRWAAVLVLYATLLGIMTAGVMVGVPRIGAEVQRLARETPRIVTELRDNWIPSLERQLRRAMSAYATPEDTNVPPEQQPDTIEPEGVRVVPLAGGGYEVELPPEGINVEPRGERGWRITAATDGRDGQMDLMASLSQATRRLLQNAQQDALVLLGKAQDVLRALIRGIFNFFIMLMLSAYLLATSDKIFAFFRSLVSPGWHKNFDRLLERVDRGLAGVVRGQLLICLVNGVLSAIGFYLLDLKYWPILALIATVLSIIPIFGAILSSIPAIIVALQDGIGTALLTLAWIIGIHQLEANVLNPKIMGDAAKVHPVLVVFALIAGEHFFGIAGALLAVPVLSIVQSLFLHYRDIALGQPNPAAAEGAYRDASLEPPLPPPAKVPTVDPPLPAKNEAPSEGE